MESQVYQEVLSLVQKVQQVPQVHQAQDTPMTLALTQKAVAMLSLYQVPQDRMESLVRMGLMAPMVYQAHKDRWVCPVMQDQLDHRELMENRVNQEQLALWWVLIVHDLSYLVDTCVVVTIKV